MIALNHAKSVIESAPQGIIRVDRHNRHVYINDWVGAQMDIPESEILGKTARELGYPPKLCQLWESAIAQVFAEGSSLKIEYSLFPRLKQSQRKAQFVSEFVPEINSSKAIVSVLILVYDITTHKRVELELQKKAAELQAILNAYPDLYLWTDQNGKYINYHAGMEPYVPPEQFLGKRIEEVLPAHLALRFYEAIKQLSVGSKVELEYQLPMPEGEHWYEARMTLLPNHQVLTIIRDITQRKQHQQQMEAYQRQLEAANAKLQRYSLTDALTGLPNRRAFDLEFDERCQRSRQFQTPLALLLIDVDHFKSFNDRFGHQAGDEALQKVAGLLQQQARSTDFIARYGGEEFVVLLPNTTEAGGLVLAERFRQAIASAVWHKRTITISIGVCVSTFDTVGRAVLYEADKALYQAKSRGRNCIISTTLLQLEQQQLL